MQKTNKLFRLLAGLLAVLMLSICIPVSAFAEGEDDRSILCPEIIVTRVVDSDSSISLDPVTIHGNIIWYGEDVLNYVKANEASITEQGTYNVVRYELVDNKDIFGNDVGILIKPETYVKAHLEKVAPKLQYTINIYKDNVLDEDLTRTYKDGDFAGKTYVSDLFQDIYNSFAGAYTFSSMKINGEEAGYGTTLATEGSYNVDVYFTAAPKVTYNITVYGPDGQPLNTKTVTSIPEDAVYVSDLFQDIYNNYTGTYAFDYMTINGSEADYGTLVAQTGSYDVAVYFKAVSAVSYEFNFYDVDSGKEIASYLKVDSIPSDAVYVADLFQDVYNQLSATYTFDHMLINNVEAGYGTAVEQTGNYNVAVYFSQKEVKPSFAYSFYFYDLNGTEIAKPIMMTQDEAKDTDKYVADLFQDVHNTLSSKYAFDSMKEDGEVIDYGTLIEEGNHTVYVYFKDKPADMEDVSFKFEFVDMTGETIAEPMNCLEQCSDDVIGSKLSDLVANKTAELKDKYYVFDHFALVYVDGTESSALQDPVVVPDYNGMTIKVYFAQPALYRFTYINEATGEVIHDTEEIQVADVKTNVDKYVLDLLAETRRGLENDGWHYEGIRYVFNPDEYDQNSVLVVPGGPYEYKVCFTKAESTSDNGDSTTTTVTSSNNNTTTKTASNEVVKSAAPADNTAKVMPQTGLTAETPVVFGVMMVAALAGAGAYLFAIRKKLN